MAGGAQPLAITMNEGVCLAVEVDPQHIQRRLETGYCDEMASTLDEALHQVREAVDQGQPLSIGLIGNAAEIYPEMVRRGIVPDVVTDQTSAHDALNGYIPAGLSLQEADELRKRDPQGYIARSLESMVTHVRAMLDMQRMGAIVFDYGNNLRGQALAAGETHALDFPGFVPAYIRPLFCRGKGPFRWVALSGDPGGYLSHRRGYSRTLPGGCCAETLDHAGPPENTFPGSAGAYLLVGLRRARQSGAGFQRAGAQGLCEGSHCDRARSSR